ncbi:MAG: DUF2971 domain-containing protein [Acidobacteriota bacterium]|nr:DUF2971 domain-containing protein [Acidobacteriota bacterium]
MLDATAERLESAHFNLREEIKRFWAVIDAKTARPETIFHYTSADALHSIVGKKQLWATEALCMNDPTEGIHAGRLIAERLRHRTSEVPAHLLRLFSDEELSEVLNNQVFLVSFCDAADLLSQWRAYGLDGRGYAIGFHTQALLDSASHGGRLVPVSYNHAELEGLLTSIIDFAVDEITRIKFNKEEFDTYWRFVGNYLLQSVIRFKNPAYQEEREWRLIYYPSAGIAFRTSGGRIVPYIKVPFGSGAIKCIRLGPKCSSRDRRVLANYLRAVCGSGLPAIENSVVPMA